MASWRPTFPEKYDADKHGPLIDVTVLVAVRLARCEENVRVACLPLCDSFVNRGVEDMESVSIPPAPEHSAVLLNAPGTPDSAEYLASKRAWFPDASLFVPKESTSWGKYAKFFCPTGAKPEGPVRTRDGRFFRVHHDWEILATPDERPAPSWEKPPCPKRPKTSAETPELVEAYCKAYYAWVNCEPPREPAFPQEVGRIGSNVQFQLLPHVELKSRLLSAFARMVYLLWNRPRMQILFPNMDYLGMSLAEAEAAFALRPWKDTTAPEPPLRFRGDPIPPEECLLRERQISHLRLEECHGRHFLTYHVGAVRLQLSCAGDVDKTETFVCEPCKDDGMEEGFLFATECNT